MRFDAVRDSGFEPLQPTPEEADAWASREHERREAWAAGPSEQEKDEWARRYRRRAAFGLAESSLGPSPDEVDQWAERERKRRQTWLAGPTEQEKREWARQMRGRGPAGYPASELTPADEEIEAWAVQERARRHAWLAGPTEEEKRRWLRREAGGIREEIADLAMMDSRMLAAAERLLRDANLASRGSVSLLARAPSALWSYLVRAGRDLDDDLYQPPPRRRVRF